MDRINSLVEKIKSLKKEKEAIILAHNYQLPEVQDIADYVGDSLGLAREATKVKDSVIVLCGVYFMAETAAILNPDKVVLIPDKGAGCPLANFAPTKMVLDWKKRYSDYAFVAYVNTSAEVKALCDVCCTSSNAVEIVRKIDSKRIVFLPDKNLGAYVKKMVPEKDILLWPGFCMVHEKADIESIIKAREENPGALIIAHPECPMEILEIADGVCSTGQMVDFVKKHPYTRSFIVVTEWGMNYALKKSFPDRTFIEPLKRMECKNMKKITLEKVLKSLESLNYEVNLDKEIAENAKKSIVKMFEMMK